MRPTANTRSAHACGGMRVFVRACECLHSRHYFLRTPLGAVQYRDDDFGDDADRAVESRTAASHVDLRFSRTGCSQMTANSHTAQSYAHPHLVTRCVAIHVKHRTKYPLFYSLCNQQAKRVAMAFKTPDALTLLAEGGVISKA